MAASKGKKPVERQFVEAGTGKKVSNPKAENAKAGEAPTANYKEVATQKAELNPGRAKGLRTAAVILWIVGIIFEVLAILVLTRKIYFGDDMMLYLIVGIVVDLIAVIIASQLWKKANHIDPPSEANKAEFFVKSQLGAILSVVAFLPLLILLLTNKNLDAKTKKTVSIIAACALALAVGTSVDYNPVSAEDMQSAQQEVTELGDDSGVVYWTTFGKKYHLDPNCQAIKNSATVYQGSINEAFEANRSELCSFCKQNAEEAGGTVIEEPADVDSENAA